MNDTLITVQRSSKLHLCCLLVLSPAVCVRLSISVHLHQLVIFAKLIYPKPKLKLSRNFYLNNTTSVFQLPKLSY